MMRVALYYYSDNYYGDIYHILGQNYNVWSCRNSYFIAIHVINIYSLGDQLYTQ